jgi:Domain of unknown function (DUF5615)
LVKLLGREGHDVLIPADFAMAGAKDPSHLRRAIREKAAFLSHNYDDFELLHDLLMEGQGHHYGILIIRNDNDPTRDMHPPHISRAIRNLMTAGVVVADQCIILNHWR